MSTVHTRPDKEWDTLRARAALLGATLCRTDDDRGAELYVVSKWGVTRHLASLEAVSDWLDRLAGKVQR